ncbi:MAG: hypothetical protein J0L84_02050 [Verrucomicrobia bacterium]|nr:hypothetical protein [Verrucomicrobiota bacterium]
MSRENLLQQIHDSVEQRLPRSLRAKLEWEKKGPRSVSKKGCGDILRLGLLPPTPRHPRGFWDPSWACYEVSVGRYDPLVEPNIMAGSPPIAAQAEVQFYHASHQKGLGSGHYLKQVERILRDLQILRPAHWTFIPAGGQDSSHVVQFLKRRYSLAEMAGDGPQVAADDLIWLIENTLPKFQALQAVP